MIEEVIYKKKYILWRHKTPIKSFETRNDAVDYEHACILRYINRIKQYEKWNALQEKKETK